MTNASKKTRAASNEKEGLSHSNESDYSHLVTKAYDFFADRYDCWHWQEFWRRNEWPLCEKLLKTANNTRCMLDVGIGTGFYFDKISGLSSIKCGLDISLGMLRVANRRLRNRVYLVRAEATSIPFSTGTFDIVLILRVASHIPDLSLLAIELKRVLKKGGRLIVSDIAPEHSYLCTEFDAPYRKVMVETHKHSIADWRRIAEINTLRFISSATISAENAVWLPASGFSSIDRTGNKPVGFVLAFDRN